MSREEAAAVYLDVLLGFRNDYRKYQEAAEMLKENDRVLLESAVFERSGFTAGVYKTKEEVFQALN